MLKYATREEYQQWKSALDAAVVEKCFATSWQTEKSWQFFSDFGHKTVLKGMKDDVKEVFELSGFIPLFIWE